MALTDSWLEIQSKNAMENDLRKEFEMYGAIEYLTIVKDKKGRSRGYAFIVYEREKDMKGSLRPRGLIYAHYKCC